MAGHVMNWTDNQISNQLNFIADSISTLIQPYGGVCQVVDDENKMWTQAWQSSQKLIVYVTWGGDKPWGPMALAGVTHRVTREWILGIKRGEGYTAVRGDTFSKTTAVPPFADMVDIIRNFVRGMIGISEDFGTDNVNVKKWSQGAMVMSGRLLTFTTQNDLQAVLLQPYDIATPPPVGLPAIA